MRNNRNMIWFLGLEKKTTESNNAEIAFVICENCAFLAPIFIVVVILFQLGYSRRKSFIFSATSIAMPGILFFSAAALSFSPSPLGVDEIFILILLWFLSCYNQIRVIELATRARVFRFSFVGMAFSN